ncbi:MAG TPA: hypothetical protein DCQ31_10875 [Bacteroidales bacterium]|nr:hypothetical protein [Bacteroidales bacterium]
MKSRQYNFFSEPAMLEKFEKYLKSKGFIFISSPAKELPFPENKLLSAANNIHFPVAYITLKDLKNGIVGKFIDTQNYFTPDVIVSPIIEFMLPATSDDSEIKNRSRIYFVSAYFNDENELVEKDKLFVSNANKVLNWCRRNFKNKY